MRCHNSLIINIFLYMCNDGDDDEDNDDNKKNICYRRIPDIIPLAQLSKHINPFKSPSQFISIKFLMIIHKK